MPVYKSLEVLSNGRLHTYTPTQALSIYMDAGMEKSLKMDRITLGVCYYPEHWPRDLWENDLDRMLTHGLSVIRIAEFAWSKIEPIEGEFVFTFFDAFLALAHRKGMKVIFCTPYRNTSRLADSFASGGSEC